MRTIMFSLGKINKDGRDLTMADIIEFLILTLIYLAIPIIVLYFIIKEAVKNAIKELKNKNIL